ncbi:pseudouridine synthase [Anaeromassilibacillus sp. SJQ-1]|uniref:pseudouridine synthase n=1 Tax=Anaeromassilibacillus sp. SJQ-1 TaxID=3375419 RepID=UPI003989598B
MKTAICWQLTNRPVCRCIPRLDMPGIAWPMLLRRIFRERANPLAFRPIYRLDRDTTGVLVLAKNPYAAARLAQGISKVYLAVCEGV